MNDALFFIFLNAHNIYALQWLLVKYCTVQHVSDAL